MRLLPDLLPRHRALGRHQDHEEAKARIRGEEGARGDGRQVLHVGKFFSSLIPTSKKNILAIQSNLS